ncbi:MAG: type IV toxin-antitoxin system AbiEi family antitoxin domain-containing protein [Acidimicrobiia bacterium]
MRSQTQATLDALAARQHGVISRAQIQASGAGDAEIHHRISSGAWIRLAPGIYALRSAPGTWERDLMAALSSRPRALACRRSAARLHGLEGFRTKRPEIVIPYGGNARSALATVRRSVYFADLGRTAIRGFPATDVAETLFMVAGVVGEERLQRTVDDALAASMCTIDELNDVHLRHLGDRIPGIARFERTLETRQGRAYVPPASELERRLVALLGRAGVPEAVFQHPLPWSSGPRRVDAYLPAWSLVVEADGRAWHTRVADFERDRERDNAAAANGVAVLRFTWSMLTRRNEHCLDLLTRTGAHRTTLSNHVAVNHAVAQ